MLKREVGVSSGLPLGLYVPAIPPGKVITAQMLKRAAKIRKEIEDLQKQVDQILCQSAK
jgi:hypothetical protein